jgi:hypothetical protein
MYSVESQQTFPRNTSPPSSRSKHMPNWHEVGMKQSCSCNPLHAGLFLVLFFDPEDESDIFLRHISGLPMGHMALHLRKSLFLNTPLWQFQILLNAAFSVPHLWTTFHRFQRLRPKWQYYEYNSWDGAHTGPCSMMMLLSGFQDWEIWVEIVKTEVNNILKIWPLLIIPHTFHKFPFPSSRQHFRSVRTTVEGIKKNSIVHRITLLPLKYKGIYIVCPSDLL